MEKDRDREREREILSPRRGVRTYRSSFHFPRPTTRRIEAIVALENVYIGKKLAGYFFHFQINPSHHFHLELRQFSRTRVLFNRSNTAPSNHVSETTFYLRKGNILRIL